MNVQAVLTESLRAPSAHNAQPWRITPQADGGYELHYDHLDYLPYDPDDRDAYLAMGAFLETANLAAQRHGLIADFTPVFSRNGTDLYVGSVRFREAERDRPADPLAGPAADRHTNRQPYDRTPLPDELRSKLTALGCTLVPPGQMARLVRKASVLSWNDRRFVADLDRWISADPGAPAGMTPAGLPLSRLEWTGLRLALRLGRLPAPLAHVAAARDIRLLAQAQAVAVLGAADLTPPVLADAGRRLLRSWVTINAAGFAYHPISIAVDRPETAPEVAATAGVPVPVAVFRIGRPRREAPRSNRRDLTDVLRPGLRPPARHARGCTPFQSGPPNRVICGAASAATHGSSCALNRRSRTSRAQLSVALSDQSGLPGCRRRWAALGASWRMSWERQGRETAVQAGCAGRLLR